MEDSRPSLSANNLFFTDELCAAYRSALCDGGYGRYEWADLLCRIIRKSGEELQEECTNQIEHAAAKILRSKVIRAQVMERMRLDYNEFSEYGRGTFKPAKGAEAMKTDLSDLSSNDLSDVPSDPGESLRSASDAIKQECSRVEQFVLKSYAYETFRWIVFFLVLESYKDRLRGVLSQSACSAYGSLLEPAVLEVLVNELSWVPASRIRSFVPSQRSVLDGLKAWVELSTREKWQWWPLSAKAISIPTGCHRISWSTPSGHEQYLDYKAWHEGQLRVVLSSIPGFLELLVGESWHKPAYVYGQGQNVAGGSVSPGTTQTQSGTSSGHDSAPSPAVPSALNNNNTTPSLNFNTQSSTSHLYLCVTRGDEYRFPCISIRPQMTVTECFNQLRKHYSHARGMLRQMFSIWRFDHCEFYQFRKYALGTGEPAKIDFPHEDDKCYSFFPRPIDPGPPTGPIAEGEFRDYFYKHGQPCNFVQRSWQRLLFHRLLSTRADTSAIRVLPKRLAEMQFNDGSREAFWGLYAVERISFAWVAAYGFLANVPSLVYFFLWLFYWRHESDVQGASVPVSLSLTLTAMWIGLILASKK